MPPSCVATNGADPCAYAQVRTASAWYPPWFRPLVRHPTRASCPTGPFTSSQGARALDRGNPSLSETERVGGLRPKSHAGTARTAAARRSHRSRRPRGSTRPANAGSPGWARATRAPAPGPSSRRDGAHPATGGSRCARRRSPRSCGRPRARPRPGWPRPTATTGMPRQRPAGPCPPRGRRLPGRRAAGSRDTAQEVAHQAWVPALRRFWQASTTRAAMLASASLPQARGSYFFLLPTSPSIFRTPS